MVQEEPNCAGTTQGKDEKKQDRGLAKVCGRGVSSTKAGCIFWFEINIRLRLHQGDFFLFFFRTPYASCPSASTTVVAKAAAGLGASDGLGRMLCARWNQLAGPVVRRKQSLTM